MASKDPVLPECDPYTFLGSFVVSMVLLTKYSITRLKKICDVKDEEEKNGFYKRCPNDIVLHETKDILKLAFYVFTAAALCVDK